MAENTVTIHVANTASAAYARNEHNASTAAPQAKLRAGPTGKLQPPGTAVQVMTPQGYGLQGLPAIPERSVLSRRVVTVQAFRAKAPEDVLQRAQILGVTPQTVRNGARALLAGRKPATTGNARVDKAGYLSHLYAAALLEEGVSEDDTAARLAHTGNQSFTAKQFAEEYQRLSVASDPEGIKKFKEFVENILAGLDTTADDVGGDRAEDLKKELEKARDDEEKLIGILRTAQGLESMDGGKGQQARGTESRVVSREDRRKELQYAIEVFETEELQGGEVVAGYNAARVAATTSDPEGFTEVYAEMVSKPLKMIEAMQLFARKFGDRIDELMANVGKLQQARADDLNSFPPSRDVIRLGQVIGDLGTTFVFSTLIDEVRDLSEHMFRTGHAHAG